MLKPLVLSILAAVILVVAVMKLLGRDDPADSYLSPETTSEPAADSHAGVDAELVGETESGERTGARKVVPEPPLDPEPTAASHSFLPEELQEVAFLLPEYFDSFQQGECEGQVLASEGGSLVQHRDPHVRQRVRTAPYGGP